MGRRLNQGLTGAVLGVAAAMLAPQAALADVAVNINGPTLTITAIADGSDTAPEIELVSASGNDYEIRYNSSVGMTVTEDEERCTDGGASVSEVQCERDILTDIVLNSDATVDTEWNIFFTDDDDVLLNGGDGSDTLDAGAGGMANADVLNGGEEVDDLEAGDGGDVLNGGDGNDTLDGDGDSDATDGVDMVNGEGDSDTLDGGDGGDTVSGGDANDTNVHGGAGIDTVNGNDGNDTINGDADGDTLNGGIGTDTLRGDAGNDTLNGDADNDTLEGGQNAAAPQDTDTLNGGADNDLLRNSEGADDFNGGPSSAAGDEADYQLTAGTAGVTADNDDAVGDDGRSGEGDSIGADVENLTGDDGPDVLTGNSQPNVIDGQEGADNLRGGPGPGPDGADDLIGGSGDDDASYTGRTDDLDVDIGGGTDDDGASCPGGGCEADTVAADIEDLLGGSGDDDLTGDANANDLDGAGGDDELKGGPGPGADGADELIGGTHGTALGQNSSLGDAVSYADRTGSVVATIGGGNNDGAGGCPAGAGCEDDDVRTDIENLTGGTVADTLAGDGDANRFSGGGGSDSLAGGQQAGPDGADNFSGGSESDTVTYTARTDGVNVTLNATVGGSGPEGDSIGNTVENATGGTGPDVLTGSVVANILSGGDGDDVLSGGVGAGPDGGDDFLGGNQVDTVDFGTRADALNADIGGGNDDNAELDDVQTSVENMVGGTAGDTLIGGSGPNVLSGGDGDDFLRGSNQTTPDGADTFNGGADGTDGDFVTYGPRADAVVSDLGPGADEDGDVIGADIENLAGGSGADTLTGDAGANRLVGSIGNDILTGLGGADEFSGGTSDDTLFTADGVTDPVIDCGTTGEVTGDTVNFDAAFDTPNVDCEIQNPAAPPSADLSLTMTVSDALPAVGTTTTFTLTLANGGPDDPAGVAVADLLPAGLTHVSNAPSAGTTYDPVTGVWSAGTIVSGSSKTLGITARVTQSGTITNVAEVSSSPFADPDSIPNNGAPAEDDRDTVSVNGLAVAAATCAGKRATIVGTAAANVLNGTPGADVIAGLGGGDRVLGLGGNDTVCGGAGNDTAVGGAGKDLLLGQAGKDRLKGGAGRDTLKGGGGRDRLAGGGGGDKCIGQAGRDLALGCEKRRSI